ncbi:MAG: hypothetical protein LBV26_08375 [Bacteroidales bacterium]|jgi:hypothetical protein|nr:hypothetical protein [Bacteroidales bacterium]
MAQSVSNDALWVKLSEIEKKIEMMKTSVSTQEQTVINSELKANKEEIIEIFKRCIQGLGTHCDSHFKTIHENIKLSNELTKDEFQMWVWMQEKENEREKIEQEKLKSKSAQDADNSYLNFKFFKVRKTSVVIAILGMLVFILTVFSMKQQNDYSLLMDEYYRQDIVIDQLKRQGGNLWYYSPFLEETEPSFKVNPARNEWSDFGLAKGGNILDFVVQQYGTDSVSYVLQIIAGKHRLYYMGEKNTGLS